MCVICVHAGVADPDSLKGFDWLVDDVDEVDEVDEVEAIGGLKLMMTLTNCVNEHGGLQQYVR